MLGPAIFVSVDTPQYFLGASLPVQQSPWLLGGDPTIFARLRALQARWGTTVDGLFGDETLAAAEAYQK